MLRQPLLRQCDQRDHALVRFPRIGAEAENSVLDEDQAFNRRIGVKYLGRRLCESEARHQVWHIADALAVDLAAQRLAVRLVSEREDRGRMRMIDEFVRNERMQQRLDRRIWRHWIDQIGALHSNHFLIGKFVAPAKFKQRRKPYRWQASRLDRAHVPAGALDAESFNGIAVEIGQPCLHGGVAAAMQNEAGVLAQQARGVDPERQIAADAGITDHRGFGVTIDPGALHQLFSFGYSAAAAIRSGNAADSAARSALSTPRSVISPVTSRAGVTSNA